MVLTEVNHLAACWYEHVDAEHVHQGPMHVADNTAYLDSFERAF